MSELEKAIETIEDFAKDGFVALSLNYSLDDQVIYSFRAEHSYYGENTIPLVRKGISFEQALILFAEMINDGT